MSFEFDIEPIDNEAGDFHHRFSVELFKAFANAKKDRGITQRKIADIIGVDKSQVSRILRGIGNPTIRTISDLAFALECKPTLTFTPITGGDNGQENHASRRTPTVDAYGVGSCLSGNMSSGSEDAVSVYHPISKGQHTA